MPRKLTTERFIERSKLIHDGRYNYSKVEYINARTNVCIICPIHGEFWQKPTHHLYSESDCPLCGKINMSNKQRKTLDVFINSANLIHGNEYDYSNVIYINRHTEVYIICPIHGGFKQTPKYHLEGNGCPACRASKGEKMVKRWLMEHNINHVSEYKFDDCRNINPLPFDFYLPELNVCIEYDGIQHFESIEHFGGIAGLKSTQKHDNIKNKYCIHNNIQLIRIRYDESVNDKLMNIIKH